MASASGDSTISSAKLYSEIQSEHQIYQISSSENTRKVTERMKKNVNEITRAIENTRKITYDKKIDTDELKVSLSEKKQKLEKLQQELKRVQNQVELNTKKALNAETETAKIKTAIDKIKYATEDVDAKYTEQSQSELMNALVKLTLETEKAQSDLNAIKKMETIIIKKLQEAELDYNKTEAYTTDKINETERSIANVATTIEHIIKSYDEITVVSKDLLKSAISTKTGFEKNDLEFGQNQESNDIKIPI